MVNQTLDGVRRSVVKSALFRRMTSQGVGEKMYHHFTMTRRYVTSRYQSRKLSAVFDHVHTYCMFVGHARSGGSIMGALLDAHPNIVLGDEVDALQYVPAGFSRDQIYQLILARSVRQANKGRTKGGRDGKTYSYFVPGQWQGRFSDLHVIGDSKAGISTQRLAHKPALLHHLQQLMPGIDVKIIHIVRNPYDTISTMNLRAGRSLESGITRYFANCATIADLRTRIDTSNIALVKHESFVAHPKEHLQALCGFLGVGAPDDYLDACVSILYHSPARSRDKVQWSTALIDDVQRQIEKFDFLRGYAFDT